MRNPKRKTSPKIRFPKTNPLLYPMLHRHLPICLPIRQSMGILVTSHSRRHVPRRNPIPLPRLLRKTNPQRRSQRVLRLFRYIRKICRLLWPTNRSLLRLRIRHIHLRNPSPSPPIPNRIPPPKKIRTNPLTHKSPYQTPHPQTPLPNTPHSPSPSYQTNHQPLAAYKSQRRPLLF